jgi:hypothetical protein
MFGVLLARLPAMLLAAASAAREGTNLDALAVTGVVAGVVGAIAAIVAACGQFSSGWTADAISRSPTIPTSGSQVFRR